MENRKPYPSDVSDEEWAFVAPYLTLFPLDAGQRKHSLREVFNAVRYVVRCGCPWRMLPNDLPPWSLVYQQMQRWLKAGCFEEMVHDLRVLLRLAEGLIGPLPPLAAGVLELTNGILRLTPDRRGFVTAAALLGWGGLSVHCQTAAVTAGSGISLRLYVPAKAVQAALSAGLAALLAPYLLP